MDGDGQVWIVKYHLDTTGTDCPCLRRSKVSKQPVALSDNFSVEVQYVQNGTLAMPIFSYYDASNNPIDLSSYTGNIIDGTLTRLRRMTRRRSQVSRPSRSNYLHRRSLPIFRRDKDQ